MKIYLSFAVFVIFAVSAAFSLLACGSDNEEEIVNPSIGIYVDNGHEYVDLGLPSGLKWATCNVGAYKPEDNGEYFAWGETKVKAEYSWTSPYTFGNDYLQLTKYCTNSKFGKNGFFDDKTTLEFTDDAAHANWGGQWRMPTKNDFDEL